MKKSLYMIVLLLINTLTHAGNMNPQVSDDSLQKLYSELHYLREVGLEIHAKYDLKKNPEQARFCGGEYGYVSTRAKATIGIANRLRSDNREEYIQTGWKALECASCRGDVKSCDAIPPTLDVIKAEFKAKQSAQ